MAPGSPFTEAIDKEERCHHRSHCGQHPQADAWADALNQEEHKGRIEIRGYQCMTLDFCWRIDDEIFMGPYWFDRLRQITVTYKLKSPGRCFDMYAQYFEEL